MTIKKAIKLMQEIGIPAEAVTLMGRQGVRIGDTTKLHVCPIIYPDSCRNSRELYEYAVEAFQSVSDRAGAVTEDIGDWGYIKLNLIPVVRQRSLSGNLAGYDLLDLRVTGAIDHPDGYVHITSEFLQHIGVTDQEYREAIHDIMRIEEPLIMNIADYLEMISREDNIPVKLPEYDSLMTVIKYNRERYGGATIADMELLKTVSDHFGTDLYIYPVSVNNILALPAPAGRQADQIRNGYEVIREQNEMQHPEDVLSYSFYYYDRSKHELEVLPLEIFKGYCPWS